MKKIIVLLLTVISFSPLFAQLNVSYVGDYSYTAELSDVWGYAAPDGTEYAIVGVNNGVSILNLADPANPVESDFIPGASSTWRDIKTWGDHAYVTNETSGGLLVIDLSTLPGEVESFEWTPNIPGLGTLTRAHNLWIDEFGFAYLCGANLNGGGLIFVDVATTPGQPIYAGKGSDEYSHDVYVRDNLAYSSEINIGEFGVYDVTDKANVVLLAAQETQGQTAHNAWLSDDSNILFTTDETGGGPVGSYDVSDPTNVIPLDNFRPLETLGTGVIPHNVHVFNDFVIVSYYTDGCIILDGARPDNLIEVGNFDTYIPANTGFNGAWGAYPFLPSGLILVSDIGNGLYVLQPNYVRACYLEGKVTDAVSGIGINGATIDILADLAIENSNLIGEYKTGLATAGNYGVVISKPGYISATADVELINGEVTILNVELQPLPSFAVTGTVRDELTLQPVPDAKVQILNNDFEYNLQTDALGNFTVSSFFEGNYDIIAGKWGYKTAFVSAADIDENNNALDIKIGEGLEDIFSLDLGWTVSGNAVQGHFERGNPIAVAPPQTGYEIQPDNDVNTDPGNSCYITGNSADLFGGVQINGTTTLTSPAFDLSGYSQPHITFSYWLFTANIQGNPVAGNDKLLVKISNGTTTKTVAQYSYTSFLVAPQWINSDIIVKDQIEPSANMHIIFEIGDNDPAFADIAEAGVDFFAVYDDVSPANEVIDASISLSVFPNPSNAGFNLNYKLENWKEGTNLLVYNLLGQLVETQPINNPEGKIAIGDLLGKGIYFVKIQQEDKVSASLKLVKQ